MPHVAESVAKHGGLLSVIEQDTKFGFRSRREDWRHDGGVDMDGAIEWWRSRVWLGRRCVATVGCRERRDHPRESGRAFRWGRMRHYGRGGPWRWRSNVELRQNGRRSSWEVVWWQWWWPLCLWFGRTQGAECHQHGGVNRARVVEEGADDLLKAREGCGWEWRSGVVGFGVLDCGP